MGNACCFSSFEKGEQLIIKSELFVDISEDINGKYLNDNLNINIKNGFYSKKTTTAQADDDFKFVNPLPDIVIIKRKKNFN